MKASRLTAWTGTDDACHADVEAVHTRMLADLDDHEQAYLTELLKRCIHALQR